MKLSLIITALMFSSLCLAANKKHPCDNKKITIYSYFGDEFAIMSNFTKAMRDDLKNIASNTEVHHENLDAMASPHVNQSQINKGMTKQEKYRAMNNANVVSRLNRVQAQVKNYIKIEGARSSEKACIGDLIEGIRVIASMNEKFQDLKTHNIKYTILDDAGNSKNKSFFERLLTPTIVAPLDSITIYWSPNVVNSNPN